MCQINRYEGEVLVVASVDSGDERLSVLGHVATGEAERKARCEGGPCGVHQLEMGDVNPRPHSPARHAASHRA